MQEAFPEHVSNSPHAAEPGVEETPVDVASSQATSSGSATAAPAPAGQAAPPVTAVQIVVDVAGPPIPLAIHSAGGANTSVTTALVSAQGPSPATVLPTTGVDALPQAALAASLLLAGAFAVMATRRRSQPPARALVRVRPVRHPVRHRS